LIWLAAFTGAMLIFPRPAAIKLSIRDTILIISCRGVTGKAIRKASR
jgi:hypothetical protein